MHYNRTTSPARHRRVTVGVEGRPGDSCRPLGRSRPPCRESSARASKSGRCCAGLSLTVQRGEVVGLLGPNGAGKTTCFYLMTGLMAADYGRVFLDGHDITGTANVPPRALGPRLSAAGGLNLSRTHGGEQHPRRAGSVRDRRATSASLCSTSCSRSSPSPTCAARLLSRSRAASAAVSRSHGRWPRSRASSCSTSRYRESTPSRSAEIRELVAHLKDRGIGVLLTDHNVREALDIVDRAYIINEGMPC